MDTDEHGGTHLLLTFSTNVAAMRESSVDLQPRREKKLNGWNEAHCPVVIGWFCIDAYMWNGKTNVSLVPRLDLTHDFPSPPLPDKVIRHRACSLKDTAHAIFASELDPEFGRMCDEIKEARRKRGENARVGSETVCRQRFYLQMHIFISFHIWTHYSFMEAHSTSAWRGPTATQRPSV